MIRIEIPNAKPLSPTAPPAEPATAAADLVIATLEQLGADVMKIGHNTMGIALVRAWSRGEMGVDQFRRSIRNLMILNPALAAHAK